MTSLYVLATEYRAAAETLANMEMDEQTVSDTLEGLAGALEVKATNIAMFARNLEALAESIKDAEKRMADRRKAIEVRAARIRGYLLDNMVKAEISGIESPYFNLAIRDNPESVVIDSENLIPAEFIRHPEPPPPAPDKKAISKAIKDGIDVPGAHLARSKRLEIK